MSTAQQEMPPGRLVVVGASAGGVEALSVLLSTLPADFPAPIVLAQHLDPRRRSNLEPILARRSKLPTILVQDEEPAALRPGTVYVVPSNRHVSIRDGHVSLEGDHGGRPRPSVDLLLSTAALSYGENLIAVILTGSGSDGASGAVEVSNRGGIVIIQNPATAQYPSMPQALPPTVVDHSTDLEQIGPLLGELLSSGVMRPPATDDQGDPLQDILARVGRQANVDFRTYKPTTVIRRVNRRMAATHTRTLRDYDQYLAQHPEELGELIMAFLIKVTGFLRDAEAFDYLRRHILAAVVERARANGRTLRLWSAGCATGEEAYSLALLLADLLGPELSSWSIKVFATDLDEGAISFARRGLYPANLLANLPDDYTTRFFEPVEQGYRVSKLLRQMVIFGQQDLSRGVPFPRIDVVVCRNVLIYFKPELQQSVLNMFAYSLHESRGYLFLGQAETVRPVRTNFELVSKKWRIYCCLPGPTTGLAEQGDFSRSTLPATRRGRLGQQAGDEAIVPPLEGAPAGPDPQQARRLSEWVVRALPTGMVVIDRNYHILMLNGAARRILGIRELRGEQDFLHTVRGLPYSQVRSAIDTAFREHGTITMAEMALDPQMGGDGRFLTLTLVPVQVEARTPDVVVLSVMDVSDEIRTRQRLEAVQADQKQLLDELSAANRRLSDLNKELQDANEELQATNEEMMLTQEELQATNEEFEATNEELQATNEELETNNEEMQATNEELETTNEELQARTSELQELMRVVANERARLNEIIEMAPLYILVLRGPTLLVEAIHPRYAALLAGRDGVGHPFEEALPGGEPAELLRLVREAYHQDAVRTTAPLPMSPAPTPEGTANPFFVYTIVPVHDISGRVDGVVLYAEDAAAPEDGAPGAPPV